MLEDWVCETASCPTSLLTISIGQIATQIGKARGCKVVAIDINDETLEVCKKQGADAVFNSKTNKDYVSELKKLTNGGAKAACVFSNAQAVRALLLMS